MSLAMPPSELPSNLRCMRCGYPLRGLEGSKACPECGLEIAATFAGPALGNLNPFVLHRIVFGVTGVAAGSSLLGLVYVIRLVINLAETPPRVYDYWLDHVSLIAWTVQWFSVLFFLAGREDLNSTHESGLSLRKLLMYSATLLFAIHILPTGFLDWTLQGHFWYGLAYSIVDHATLIILHLYIFTLVRRTDDLFLKRHYPFALAALAAGRIFSFLLWHIWSGFASSTLTATYIIEIVAFGYLAFLLFRFRGALKVMLPTWAKDA